MTKTIIAAAAFAWPLVAVVWIACVLSAPFQTMSVNKKLRAKAELIAAA
jgi:hypothetical protein